SRLAVFRRGNHVALPPGVHPEDSNHVQHPHPGMPKTDCRSSTQHGRQPIQMRSKERQPGGQQIGVGDSVDPMAGTLLKGVAGDFVFRNGNVGTYDSSAAHGLFSSTRSTCFGPYLTRCMNRSEEHTSELQSPCNLVCRLLLEKKKKKISYINYNITY